MAENPIQLYCVSSKQWLLTGQGRLPQLHILGWFAISFCNTLWLCRSMIAFTFGSQLYDIFRMKRLKVILSW